MCLWRRGSGKTRAEGAGGGVYTQLVFRDLCTWHRNSRNSGGCVMGDVGGAGWVKGWVVDPLAIGPNWFKFYSRLTAFHLGWFTSPL